MSSSRPHQEKPANGSPNAKQPEFDIDAETLRELKNVLNRALTEPEQRGSPAANRRAPPRVEAPRAEPQRLEPRFEETQAPVQSESGWHDAFDLVDHAADLIGSTEDMIEVARTRSEEMAERILEELRVGEAEIETLEAQVEAAEARAAEAEARANEVETKAADTEAAVMQLHDRIEAKLGHATTRRDASGRILAA
jgi:chromosome segregation ATPase